jgi:hypothetical protein
MRLTVLVLFIALPAAAYGAVCPQQSSLEFKGECAPFGNSCADRGCCDSLKCTYFSFLGMVCLMGPIFSDSRLGIELYAEMHTCVITRRTRSEWEIGIRGWVTWVQDTARDSDVPGFLGVALVVQCSSPGQAVAVSYFRTVTFISMNCGSIEKAFDIRPMSRPQMFLLSLACSRMFSSLAILCLE